MKLFELDNSTLGYFCFSIKHEVYLGSVKKKNMFMICYQDMFSFVKST